MKISIIIATFNAAKTLRCCLDSIVPQLTDETELILVDGGSKDETNAIIDSYGDKIAVHISEPDKGIYDAWNKGVKAAQGDWVMFVGADDILLPDAIANYLDFISTLTAETDFISSKINYIDENGATLDISGKLWNYDRCKYNMDVTHVASLTSKRYFQRAGLFNIDYKIVGDYELLMRGGKEMVAAFMEKVNADMRTGGASFSVKALKEQYKVKRNVAKMPAILCWMIFCVQLFLFYTYKLRHK